MQRIGIFSGTFDPIHDGHMQFALDAIQKGRLDRVYVMVERNPRRKQGVRAFEHRQTMVQLAIAQQDKLGSIIVPEDRFSPHTTLPLLTNRFVGAQLVLLAGDDMLSHMHEWPHIDYLLSGVEFMFGVRNDRTAAEEKLQKLMEVRGITCTYNFIDSHLDNVSSSRIRTQIKNHETPSYIDKKVIAYIQSEGLYSAHSSADSAKN